ncbi:MAG: nickel-binding protein [Solirubrobacteraceae bacterium]
MVYVVERYLPGLSRAGLLPRLSRLEPVSEDLRQSSVEVRCLGSTIVLEDEACFCEFEGPSETAVAEANRRADLPFDRIVPAVLVQPTHRSAEMSVSTSIRKPAWLRQSHHLAVIAAVVIALSAAERIETLAVESGTRPAGGSVPTQTSVLRLLTPQQRQYVLGILSLTPAQLSAAFGTSPTSVPGAGIGTTRASTATAPPPAALPILPACRPGSCWRATSPGRSVHSER